MSHALRFELPTALQYFATLVAEETSMPVLEAAMSLAQDEMPELDLQTELGRIDALGHRLRLRMPADAAPLQRLRLLNRYFFDELGFAGNVNHYNDRRNSFLPVVLQTRRGIPITLALIYIELASHAGLKAVGVSFPGHFLVKLLLPNGEVVVDPFTGQSLSRENLLERLVPYSGQGLGQAVSENRLDAGAAYPAREPPLALFLQPASGREMIARMLRNLKAIHHAELDWSRLERVQQRLVILLPQVWEEWRDLALALAQLGRRREAATALELYLLHRPEGADTAPLRRHLAAWRSAH